MALDIEELRSPARVWGSAEEWNEVLSTSGEDGLFLSLSWLRPWWECFGEGREMRVLRVAEDGRAVGFAPLMSTTRGRMARWRKLELIGCGPTDRGGIIAAHGRPDVHRAIWEHLGEMDDWDVVELRDILEGGPTEQAARLCHPEAEYVTSMSPHIVLDGDFAGYFSGLSRNLRSNLKRGWRHLQEQGVVHRALRAPDEVEEAARSLRELSEARWDIASVLQVPGMVDFVTAAARSMAREGKAVFHSLDMNGRSVAICMGLEDRDRYLYYLTGFDAEMSRYSPGSVLLLHIIEQCYHAGKKELDLLRGTEDYKYRFNAVDRHHVHFRARNAGMLRSAACLIREAPLS